MDVRVLVAIALVREKGLWLVARRSEGRPFAGFWEFPGGKMNSGETPGQAAVRETFEETGLVVEPMGELGTIETHHAGKTVILHLVRCGLGVAAAGASPRPCDPAVSEVRWVDPDELLTLPMPPANREILRRIGAAP